MKDPALERSSRDPYGWRSEQNRRLRELSGDPRCNPGRCRVCGAIVRVAHSREVDPPLAGAQYVIVCGSAYCMTARPLEGPLRCAGPVYFGDQGIERCETCGGGCVCCDLRHVIHFDAWRECVLGAGRQRPGVIVRPSDRHSSMIGDTVCLNQRFDNPCIHCGKNAGPYWCSHCGAT